MAYPMRSDTVLLDIYLAVANAIVNDEGTKKLLDGVVIDFDFLDQDVVEEESPPPTTVPPPHRPSSYPQPISKPTTMPPFEGAYQPRNPPRIYLLPTSIEYPRASSCNNRLSLTLNVVLDGFHYKSVRFHKLSFRLLQFLRNIPFSQIQEDGQCFSVVCELSGSSFDYDQDRQVMTNTISLNIAAYL